MGIYLPNMEMPKEGTVFVIDSAGQVWSNEWPTRGHIRLDGVTAVPIPPHGRLVDLDKLEQMFSDIDYAPYSGFDGTEPFYSAEDVAQIIRLAPTVIPAEPSKEENK